MLVGSLCKPAADLLRDRVSNFPPGFCMLDDLAL